MRPPDLETELTRLQQALAEREAEYWSTFDEAPIGIGLSGLDGHWWRINGRLRALLHYRPEDLPPSLAGIAHPDDAGDLAAARRALLEGDAHQAVRECRCRRADGAYFWAVVTVTLHRDRDGTPHHFIDAVVDVSEQRQAREDFEHIFNLSPDMICTAASGYFVRTNDAFPNVLGHSHESLRSVPFLEFVHPDDRQATEAELAAMAQGASVLGFTNRYRTAGGGYRWIEWHAKADANSGLIYAVARDQTDRRTLQRQLQQAQKMEAIGQLAGGVAHDFNNIITAINGFSELALDNLDADDPVRHDIREIRAAADRAGALTKQLLAFSRRQLLAPEPLDLSDVVENMGAMLRRIIGEDVDLRIAARSGTGRVLADRGQIEQVIMNLAVNARDAMPTGGRLTIEIATVDVDAAAAQAQPGAREGHYVMLAIADTGCGMTEEIRARLFEPFFTTKEDGRGTGLGLATVYGVVKQSGGWVTVSSEPGAGSIFRIFLPSKNVDASAPCAASELPHRPPRAATEAVLVVEDQPEVRRVITHALRRAGYVVVTAANAAEALAIMASAGEAISLLLTDVVMPSMSGRELASRVKARHPDVRVLYMSGYTDDAVTRHGVVQRDLPFLEKPFTSETLLARVRAVLDEA